MVEAEQRFQKSDKEQLVYLVVEEQFPPIGKDARICTIRLLESWVRSCVIT